MVAAKSYAARQNDKDVSVRTALKQNSECCECGEAIAVGEDAWVLSSGAFICDKNCFEQIAVLADDEYWRRRGEQMSNLDSDDFEYPFEG